MSEEHTSEPISEDVVVRLRASQAKGEENNHAAGYEAGCNWAKSGAEVTDLEAFEEAWQLMEQDWGKWFAPEGANSHRVFWVIYGDDDDNEDEVDLFWKSARSGNVWPRGWRLSDAFLRGFFDGVRNVWANVKDRL